MSHLLIGTLAFAALAFAAQATAQITFYEQADFSGRSFTAERQVGDFARIGFNDHAASAVVAAERWEVCEMAGFVGRCVVLRPGRYPSPASMGLNDRVSSVRDISHDARINESRSAQLPVATAKKILEGRR